jgi:hypothetical protein
MNALEDYLKHATKGVYGTKKLEIIAELRGSIEDRIWKLETQGLNQNQALEKVLLEFGAAKAVNAGLMKEHTMPKIFKSITIAFLIAIASLTTLNASRAEIEVVTQEFGFDTNTQTSSEFYKSYYLSFSSIKENLEAAGITVDDTPIAPLQPFKAYTKKTMPSLRFRFPGASKDTILQTAPGFDSLWKSDDGTLIQDSIPKTDLSNDHFYMGLGTFVAQLRNTHLTIRIEGWRNPVLKIGETKLQIGSEKQAVTPWSLYSSLAGQAAQAGLPLQGGWGTTSNAKNHATRVNAPAGTVYAIVTNFVLPKSGSASASNPITTTVVLPSGSASNDKNMRHIDIARVGTDGILYFKAPHNVIEFTQSREAVFADRLNVSKNGYGGSKRPAKALLMRMNSDLSVTLELPAKTRSAAIK